MLRLSKITDYGIVLLAQLAREANGDSRNARELAEGTELPAPTAVVVAVEPGAMGDA